MAGHARHGSGNLEDQIRRMILLGGSEPEEDTTPRVRLPSAMPIHQTQPQPPQLNGLPYDPRFPLRMATPSSQPPGTYPLPPHAHGPMPVHNPARQSGSASPASPHGQAFPPPGMPPPQGPPQGSSQVVPPHMRSPHHQQNHGSPGLQPVHHAQQGHPIHPHPHRQGYNQQPRQSYQGHNGYTRGGYGSQRQQRQQQVQLDPNAFQRGGQLPNDARFHPAPRNLYDPNARDMPPRFTPSDYRHRQSQYLEQIVNTEVPKVDMSQAEREEKDAFRRTLEDLCHQVCEENPDLPKVSLECFGSLQSGFASAGSDMDLVIVVQDREATSAVFSLLEDDLPRALEYKLLRSGHGARLLTRTRVPIIKVCQSPGWSFLDKLREEREKWDFLPNEKKYPHLYQGDEDDAEEDVPQGANGADSETKMTTTASTNGDATTVAIESKTIQTDDGVAENSAAIEILTETTVVTETTDPQQGNRRREQNTTWTRERKPGPLDFPKDGVGIQCDINFFNPLGLHNTQMLRCYSLCDPRVRPMILFVKSWAKLRRINSSYSGTLSSYGYVLMVLHYLINVVQPPVLPNLQLPWRPSQQCTPHGATKAEVDGWIVDFWRNEDEIQAALRNGQMSENKESVGSLLAGFFQYYSSLGSCPQFRWTTQVLSLRTEHGILSKAEKGWVKATTEEGEGKRIQHRYLFCIEDPFELTHNVARTVTHNGIVAIRDEFRRAQRILDAIGQGMRPREGDLFVKLIEAQDFIDATEAMKLNSEVPAGPAAWKPEPIPQQPEIVGRNGRGRQNMQQRQQRNGSGAQKPVMPQQQQQKPKPKALDMMDQEAFPSLGAGPKGKPKQQKDEFGSISGDKAQAYLQDFRRKKADAQAKQQGKKAYGGVQSAPVLNSSEELHSNQAESTAMGAAEAVLGDE